MVPAGPKIREEELGELCTHFPVFSPSPYMDCAIAQQYTLPTYSLFLEPSHAPLRTLTIPITQQPTFPLYRLILLLTFHSP